MQQFELNKRQKLQFLMTDLSAALRLQLLWQAEKPSTQALASDAPFAIDTLTFPQWLQFIFIEKIERLLQLNAPLPTSMSITPMATEYFAPLAIDSADIVALLTRIDLVINEKF